MGEHVEAEDELEPVGDADALAQCAERGAETAALRIGGGTAEGLIKRDGNTVMLIYALPGGETPTEFKTKEKQQMFTMKRLGK